MLELLTHIAANFSGPRYRPKIEWARDNWTHNVFRVFELLFGRKLELRREMAVVHDGQNVYRFFFTWEAAIAHAEACVRSFLKSWKLEKVYFAVPSLVPAGMPGFRQYSGYVFAIARTDFEIDNGASGSATRTVTMTASGSDRVLTAFPYNDNASLTVSSKTYDSVDLGTVVGSTSTANGTFRSYLLVAPSTTSNANLSITYSSTSYLFFNAVLYSGGAQSGQALAHGEASNAASAASITTTVTVVNANAWIAGASRHDNGGTITGTNDFTAVGSSSVNGTQTLDTNTTVATGSRTVGSTSSANGGRYLVAIEVDVVSAAGPTNLKSYDGNVKANIKSIAGNLIANVKSLSGNA